MGGTQRIAAVAAVSHARNYYNYTQHNAVQTENAQYGINVFFVSATLCGVLIAVCAACWPKSGSVDKPDDSSECAARVYTVSNDTRLEDLEEDHPPGPPPAYDTVVDVIEVEKSSHALQEVITDCQRCLPRPDSGLPTYEAAVMLKDTKL